MKRHPFPVESRMVTVYLSGGRTAFGETFKELLRCQGCTRRYRVGLR